MFEGGEVFAEPRETLLGERGQETPLVLEMLADEDVDGLEPFRRQLRSRSTIPAVSSLSSLPVMPPVVSIVDSAR